MPRYYFDTENDGARHFTDRMGIDLSDDEDARAEAVEVAPDLALTAIQTGTRIFGLVVRDDADRMVCRVTISLRIEP
jgi:ribulose 1,5-bisphosphate synthetase/thiazole synthase